jgi:hypothetical protein
MPPTAQKTGRSTRRDSRPRRDSSLSSLRSRRARRSRLGWSPSSTLTGLAYLQASPVDKGHFLSQADLLFASEVLAAAAVPGVTWSRAVAASTRAHWLQQHDCVSVLDPRCRPCVGSRPSPVARPLTRSAREAGPRNARRALEAAFYRAPSCCRASCRCCRRGMVLRDHQRRIVAMNDVHLALVGHRREELLPRPLDDLELGGWAMTQKRSPLTTPRCVRRGGVRSALPANSRARRQSLGCKELAR